jgi:cell wall-associated NlpC family hydrolase
MLSYQSLADTNIYDSPSFASIATQMAKGRYLKILQPEVLQVQLLEDGYVGFVRNLFNLEPRSYSYQPENLSESEIIKRIPRAIAYTKSAMKVTNEYLWGGTVPPNFDCSGLMQAAFGSVGIWVPRDAYQQQDFTTPVESELQAGDLIFFGLGEKANHVAMYLGDNSYIHSSGQEKGRNGIGIDALEIDDLSKIEHQIAARYRAELRGFGRVTKCYNPL